MKSHRTHLSMLLVAALVVVAGTANAADVTVGYQLVYGPWKTQMENIKKDGLGGKSVEFVKFTSGTEVINAMASGSIDISLNGSSPSAAGYSRGVDLQVVYIYDNINDAEALVVNDSITAPQDLRGKTSSGHPSLRAVSPLRRRWPDRFTSSPGASCKLT